MRTTAPSSNNLLLLLSTLPLLASAHFNLNYPKARGFDEEELTKFPCGGQDSVSQERREWPLQGKAPIQLDMGHDESLVQVLLALGNDPGDNFNLVVVPTFQEMGLSDFCLGDVRLPSNPMIKAGMNATLQVVTSGDPDGGLYNCADITFVDKALSDSEYSDNCKNATGIETRTTSDTSLNANGTKSEAGTGSGSSSESTSTSSEVAVAGVQLSGWLLGLAGFLSGMAAF